MTRCFAWLIAVVAFLQIATTLADEPKSEDYMGFFKHYVGVWKCEVSDGSSGTLTYEVAPNGQCLIGHLTIDGKPATQAVEGYDPVEKCWKHVAWYADGGHGVLIFKLDKETLSAGPAGHTFKGPWTQHTADGQKKDGIIVNEWIDKNNWTAESADWRAVVRREK
jgi:hypothetical protein